MLFFNVDNTSETLESAPHLAKKYNAIVRTFAEKYAFSNVAEDENISEMMFLAHTHTGFGRFNSPHAFAEKFSKEFESKFRDQRKREVTDIYLIGCEVGLTKDKRNSMAQVIADVLYERGFFNIQVHAIRNPQGSDNQAKGMRVSVTTDAPLGEPGKVQAIWYSVAHKQTMAKIERYDDLMRKPNRTQYETKEAKQIYPTIKGYQADKEKVVQACFSSDDVRKGLRDEAHTFYPCQANAARLYAIRKITDQINHLQEKSKKDPRIKRLTDLRSKIQQEDSDACRTHLETAANENWGGTGFKKSTTKKLIEALAVSRDDGVYKPKNPSSKSSREEAPAPKKIDEEKQPLLSDFSDKVFKRLNSPNLEAKNRDEVNAIKEAVKRYVGELTEEAKSRGCSFFTGYLGAHKLRKFRALQEQIKDMKNAAEIKECVKEMSRETWFIFSGFSTHRAENLVTNILHQHADHGTKRPEKPLEADELNSVFPTV